MLLLDSTVSTLHKVQPVWVRLSFPFIMLLFYGVSIFLLRFGVFSSRQDKVLRKGLDLLLFGKPVEAETCYRTALDSGARIPESDRVRLFVGLADALIDQGRYEEAKQYLSTALELGDPTGSGQDSMCDLLLAQKADPERAIQMADESSRRRPDFSQAFGSRWVAASQQLYEANCWARKARALLILDQRTEARQALDRALRIIDVSKAEVDRAQPKTSPAARLVVGNRLRRMKHLEISATYWQIGLALLAMRDTSKATEYFLVVRNTDIMGKYRILADQKLASLGYSDTTGQFPIT